AIGATRVADLRGHYHLKLPTIHRQHVGGGGGGGHFAGVERGPAFLFGEFDAEFEAVLFGEVGIFVGLQPAIGGDQAGISGVFGQFDIDDVVGGDVGAGG